MATLAARLEALAGAIRDKFNANAPRLLPTGGSTGQVLRKASATDGAAAWASQPVYASFSCVGKQASGSEVLGIITLPEATTFPSGLTGSPSVVAGAAAGASTVFTFSRISGTGSGAVVTPFATLTFPAGSYVGTLASSSATACAAGDRVMMTGPSTADATLADFCATLVGYR